MPTSPNRSAAVIQGIAPQFLVDDLDRAIAHYRDKLGFDLDFIYESFYAGLSRGRASVHLKCAPKTVADRAHRKANEHLDAYLAVTNIEALFGELVSRGADIIRTLEHQPWNCSDFYVQDADGYILCFSENR